MFCLFFADTHVGIHCFLKLKFPANLQRNPQIYIPQKLPHMWYLISLYGTVLDAK